MANKLSDLTIDELRATLAATEASAGPLSTSARLIRRELNIKIGESLVASGEALAREQFKAMTGRELSAPKGERR